MAREPLNLYSLQSDSDFLKLGVWWTMGCYCYDDWFPNTHVLLVDLLVVL